MKDINIEELFNVQSHIGHFKSYRQPKMSQFIYCVHNKLDIINLDYSLKQIKLAKEFLSQFDKDDIVLICENSNHLAIESIKVFNKWKAGTLTNLKYGSLSRLPKVLVIDSIKRNHNAVKEALRLQIPIVGICDTNVSFKFINKPIVMNDDSRKAIDLVFNYLLS